MNLKPYLPTAQDISKQLIVGIVVAAITAYLLSHVPALRSFMGQDTSKPPMQ